MSGGVILTLDLATRFGWAVGDIADGPAWGHIDLGGSGTSFGRRMLVYENWLIAEIEDVRPMEVIYEKPIMPRGQTLVSRCMTIGPAMITEKVCEEHCVRCLWIDNRKAKRHFAGNRNASKEDMIHAARQRGWKVLVHDEADALALWCVRAWQLDPKLAARFDPIGVMA